MDKQRSDAIRLALMGCLFFFLHGCRQQEAGDEVAVKQRASAVPPGVDGVGKVSGGDNLRREKPDVPIGGSDAKVKDAPPGTQVKEPPPKTVTYSLKEKSTIRGPQDTVRSLAFADEGKTLWSKRGYNKPEPEMITHCWDVATGEEKKSDANRKPPAWGKLPEMFAATIEADAGNGTFAASAPRGNPQDDGEVGWVVTLMDKTTNQSVAKLEHTDQVNVLAFSPDGSRLAAGTSYLNGMGGSRGTLTIWEVPSGKLICRTSGLDSVFALLFSPDGKVLASGQWRGDIKLWKQVKDDPRNAVPDAPPAAQEKAPATIQGTWKVDGHPEVQQCIIGQVNGPRHLACVKLTGPGRPAEAFFDVVYDPGEPQKVDSFFFAGRPDRVGWGTCSATGAEITIRFPQTKIVLTRISPDLDAEMQEEFKYRTNPSATAAGRAALEALKDRKRVVESAMVPNSGPMSIVFPAGAKFENADARDIAAIPGVYGLELANTHVKDVDLEFVGSLKRLQHLNLSHTSVADAGLKHLNGLKRLGSLSLQHTKITDAGLKALADLPSLRQFDLTECDQVTPSDIAAAFRALPKLPGIRIAGGYQSRNANRPLITLRPGKTGSDGWRQAVATARQASAVDFSLVFSFPDVLSDGDIDQLKEFVGLKASVIALSLGEDTKLTASGLKHLKVFSELELLEMVHGNIDDRGMQEIARLPKVKHLSLPYCKITDEAMKHLAGMAQLESVDLAGAKISDVGIMNLAEPNLRNLRRVQFGSSQQEKTIRALLPRLEEWRYPEQYGFRPAPP